MGDSLTKAGRYRQFAKSCELRVASLKSGVWSLESEDFCGPPEQRLVVFGRMPSGSHPVLPDGECYFVVQVECRHGSAAAGSASYYAHEILTPIEMALPSLFSGIEEPDSPVCLVIDTVSLRALCVIAESACKPEVRFVVRTTFCGRNDMLDFKHLEDVMLGRKAIPASIACCLTNAGQDAFGDLRFLHGSSGGRNPRRTASAIA